MENEQKQPTFLESLLGVVIGFFETGMGFLHTLMGFLMVRFFYAIPVWLVWSFVIAYAFKVPTLNFLEMWGILVGFDCFRFDITKFSVQRKE